MCFLFRKAGGAVLVDPGAVAEAVEEGMGEEEAASAEGADPAAIGDDDEAPPLAVDAMIGLFQYYTDVALSSLLLFVCVITLNTPQ